MVVNVDRPPEAQSRRRFDVGGVLLDRPFRIRRLGHFGGPSMSIALKKGSTSTAIWLGFMISDESNFGARLTDDQRAALGPNAGTTGYFTRYGTDHHAFVLFPRKVFRMFAPGESERITINQITWQVGSLAEVVAGSQFFEASGVNVRRSGRDTPGSNWHTYPLDPDGHTNELYYGIEQVGWEGYSKPRPMYNRGFRERPSLPQMSEFDEVDEALKEGVDLESGFRPGRKRTRARSTWTASCSPGALQDRTHWSARIFVDDVQRSRAFYESTLGLTQTQTVTWNGHECAPSLRVNTEHHSLALYPSAMRESLGLSPHTTLLSFGVQLANYRQLRDSIGFLRDHGVQVRQLPSELSPGIDYSYLAIDPDGHAVRACTTTCSKLRNRSRRYPRQAPSERLDALASHGRRAP